MDVGLERVWALLEWVVWANFGLLFAEALGADKVVAISRNTNNKEDVLKVCTVRSNDFVQSELRKNVDGRRCLHRHR